MRDASYQKSEGKDEGVRRWMLWTRVWSERLCPQTQHHGLVRTRTAWRSDAEGQVVNAERWRGHTQMPRRVGMDKWRRLAVFMVALVLTLGLLGTSVSAPLLRVWVPATDVPLRRGVAEHWGWCGAVQSPRPATGAQQCHLPRCVACVLRPYQRRAA
jgi:hypothetical protein